MADDTINWHPSPLPPGPLSPASVRAWFQSEASAILAEVSDEITVGLAFRNGTPEIEWEWDWTNGPEGGRLGLIDLFKEDVDVHRAGGRIAPQDEAHLLERYGPLENFLRDIRLEIEGARAQRHAKAQGLTVSGEAL